MICMLTRRWRSSQLTYSIPRKFRGLIQYLIVLDQLLNSSTGLNWKPQSILIQISSKQKEFPDGEGRSKVFVRQPPPPPPHFFQMKITLLELSHPAFTLGLELYTVCLYDDILQLYIKWIYYVLNLRDFTTKWVVLQTWRFLQNGL